MPETEASDSVQTPETAPKPRRITKRKAVEERARSYFEAIGRRDTTAMVEHLREDGIDDLIPVGVLRGRAEIARFFDELFAAVPDVELTVTRLVAGERQAAVEWRMSGHFTGTPFQGIEATGRAIELRGLDLLEVEDGEIVSITAYYDGMDFARQVGLMPPQDSGAERALKNAFNAATKVRRAVTDWKDSR